MKSLLRDSKKHNILTFLGLILFLLSVIMLPVFETVMIGNSDHYSLSTIVSQNEEDFNERTIPSGTPTETSLNQLREKLESCPSYALFRQEIGYNAATYELVFRFYSDLIQQEKLEKDTMADDEMVVTDSEGNFRVFRDGEPITAKEFQQIFDEADKRSSKIDGNIHVYECCCDNEKCKKERIKTLDKPFMTSHILEKHYWVWQK